MDPFFSLRIAQADAFAARDFPAPFNVTISFWPSHHQSQHLLDRATTLLSIPLEKDERVG